jgi:hypothetical protein
MPDTSFDRIARVVASYMESYARTKGYQIELDGYFSQLPVNLFDQGGLAMNIEDEFGVSIPESLFHSGTFRQIATAFDAQLRK